MISRITQRQHDVLRLALDGLSSSAIARELGISNSTVRNHISSAYKLLPEERLRVMKARKRSRRTTAGGGETSGQRRSAGVAQSAVRS